MVSSALFTKLRTSSNWLNFVYKTENESWLAQNYLQNWEWVLIGLDLFTKVRMNSIDSVLLRSLRMSSDWLFFVYKTENKSWLAQLYLQNWECALISSDCLQNWECLLIGPIFFTKHNCSDFSDLKELCLQNWDHI